MYKQLGTGTAVSRQAVSKARKNLDPAFIQDLVRSTVSVANSCEDLELYAGKYRLCAIDGSGVSVNQSLADVFGTRNKKATALASVAYDPLNNIIMDGSLNRYEGGERAPAKANIEVCEALSHGKPFIYLFDRGYPSGELFGWLMQRKLMFLARVSKTTNVYEEAKGDGEWVSLDYESGCYKVRVMKIALSSGETETLVTNLNEHELPYEQAGELYFKRWGIEVKLEELKTKLALERMRGKSKTVVLQDFYAAIWLANIGAALRWETDAEIARTDASKQLKYPRKTDVNRLLDKLRGKLFVLMDEPSQERRQAMLEALVADIARYPVDVKFARSVPRCSPLRPRPCNEKNVAAL
jgi:hypothetical protein